MLSTYLIQLGLNYIQLGGTREKYVESPYLQENASSRLILII